MPRGATQGNPKQNNLVAKASQTRQFNTTRVLFQFHQLLVSTRKGLEHVWCAEPPPADQNFPKVSSRAKWIEPLRL